MNGPRRERKEKKTKHTPMNDCSPSDRRILFLFFSSFSIEAEYSSGCMISSYSIFNLFEQVTEQHTMPVAMRRRPILGFYCFLKQ